MKTSDLPLKVKIASPCPARWEDMGGDDRVRFCDHCRKNVYNLSAMSARDATNLLAAKNGNLCARIYQRADGTVLTEDCPVGVARYWRRVKTTVAGCVAAILFIIGGTVALARDKNQPDSGKKARVIVYAQNAVWQVKEWLGLNPPVKPVALVGVMCVPPPPTNPPLMGKISPAHPKQTPPTLPKK